MLKTKTKVILQRYLKIHFIFIVLILCSCSRKTEYYIDKPNENAFNLESVSELSNSDIDLIKKYIPDVIDWYNSIDISKPLPIDVVTTDIKALGDQLFENEIFQSYLDNFSSGKEQSKNDEVYFRQISIVNRIPGQIATIMMTSNMTMVLLGDPEENTMIIDEERWLELRSCIIEAISYYYKTDY